MTPARQSPPRARHALGTFQVAYAVALCASLCTSWLTHVYVGAGARELNPVTRWLIAGIGLDGTVVVRSLLLIACYHAYGWIDALTGGSVSLAGFGWIGALVNVLDAAHDLGVVLLARQFPASLAPTPTAIVLVMGVVGLLLRPKRRGSTGSPPSGESEA